MYLEGNLGYSLILSQKLFASGSRYGRFLSWLTADKTSACPSGHSATIRKSTSCWAVRFLKMPRRRFFLVRTSLGFDLGGESPPMFQKRNVNMRQLPNRPDQPDIDPRLSISL